MPTITLNGERRAVRARTLADLLEEVQAGPAVATALNEGFVPASARAAAALTEGDRVEILAPMQGG